MEIDNNLTLTESIKIKETTFLKHKQSDMEAHNATDCAAGKC